MPRKPQPAAAPAIPSATPIDGALIIDKPQGRTSHDVVDAARRILGFRQIGHLGTLDPLATGVLVLLLGRATRLAQFYVGRRKRYDSTFRFGFATDTYDADGTPLGPDTAPELDRAEIERFAAARVGCFPQLPPPYSAKKIHGRPAHELARKKRPVELKPVDIEVYDFRVNEVSGSIAGFSIECASGTYIRSLAHDMGAALGCGAHLAEIVRTAVGEFTLDQAVKLEDLERAAGPGELARYVIPLERLLPELPSVTVQPLLEKQVRHGSKFSVQIAQIQPGRVSPAQGATAELNSGEWKPARLRVFSHQERLIAIAEAVVPRTYQPIVVLEAEA
jgi:tRNA pseudouridine55 synthase